MGMAVISLYLTKKTEAYVSLETLRYYLDTMQKALDNNKVGENIKNHCHYEYDLSFEQILKLGEKAYSRYTKKLVRMCGQALNDIDKQEKLNIPYHTMEFYEPKGLTEVINNLNNNINIFL